MSQQGYVQKCHVNIIGLLFVDLGIKEFICNSDEDFKFDQYSSYLLLTRYKDGRIMLWLVNITHNMPSEWDYYIGKILFAHKIFDKEDNRVEKFKYMVSK